MNTNTTAIVINLPLSHNQIEAIKQIDGGIRFQSEGDRLRIRREQIAAAVAAGRSANHAFRHGGRVNARGEVMSDTGTPVLGGWKGSQHQAVSLAQLENDLIDEGFVLVNINPVKMEDGRGKVFLRFEPANDESATRAADVSLETLNYVRGLLGRSFSNLHVYDNRKGGKDNYTINPSAALQPGEVAKLNDPRVLQFGVDEQGGYHFTCRRPVATTSSATTAA